MSIDNEIDQADLSPKDIPVTEQVEAAGPRFAMPEWVKAQTGPGEIEDYISHPLNFAGSRGLAQTLRGVTGIVGELRYALLDVVMGVLRFANERKTVVPPEVSSNVH